MKPALALIPHQDGKTPTQPFKTEARLTTLNTDMLLHVSFSHTHC